VAADDSLCELVLYRVIILSNLLFVISCWLDYHINITCSGDNMHSRRVLELRTNICQIK
jgi:hypothetical protein